MTARLLLIGLDGADCRLLEAWSQSGVLPNLAALQARGVTQHLSTPVDATDDAVWASFQFGARLADHGRYHHVVPLGPNRLGPAYRRDEDREPFWVSLSRQGQRVAVLDVPKCAEPRAMNGIHLVDWLVHGRYFSSARSHPPGLADEVIERFGAPPPSRCNYEQEPPVRYRSDRDRRKSADVDRLQANCRPALSGQ